MASDKGPVATEAPSVPAAANLHSSIPAPNSLEALQADATRATATLKRVREGTPTSPISAIAQFNSDLSPSKVARLAGATSRHIELTGQAALRDQEEEQRRRDELYKLQVAGESDNPQYKVQSELLASGALAMSRPQDAPPDAEEQPVDAQTAEPPHNEVMDIAARAEVSPQSATSMASLSNGPPPVTASPVPMDLDSRGDRAAYPPQPQAPMDEPVNSSTSLSYPGPLPSSAAMHAPPSRGMSLPTTQHTPGGPRSPSSKRHKCPYCETEFTRHHNLKSHLLTHSQEKPFVCQTCQMRFRRLHDLKRHSKLHTGEKPHECPKCNRKFARGDALARHSKGPGGCVSRRGSLGGFGDEDFDESSQLDGDDTTMSGVIFDGASDTDLTEEDRRRLSSLKAQHLPGSSGGRPISSHAPTTNPAVFPQTGMTESPKPLSPSVVGQDGAIARQRSPSLATQFQQQQFGRHQADRHAPTVPGLTPESRYTSTGQSGGQAATGASHGALAPQPPTAGLPAGASQNGGSGDSASNNLFATDQGVWAYIQQLEENMRDLANRVYTLEQTEKSHIEKIASLEGEVTSLQHQLGAKPDGLETVS